jgi:BirA family biotin operon repressor/biotin-[acetyl-CoA-carboxylase] ligase
VSGKAVRIDDGSSGAESGFEGITQGLDERGFLRVRTAQGIRTVLSGTVRDGCGSN